MQTRACAHSHANVCMCTHIYMIILRENKITISMIKAFILKRIILTHYEYCNQLVYFYCPTLNLYFIELTYFGVQLYASRLVMLLEYNMTL